jgi:hypothetical protein
MSHHIAEFAFDTDPYNVAKARVFTRNRLCEWGLLHDHNLTWDATLLVSELVTNAIVHTHAPAVLRLCRTNRLRIAVIDASTDAPKKMPGGLGIPMIETLADSCGYTFHNPTLGKTVWCELPL